MISTLQKARLRRHQTKSAIECKTTHDQREKLANFISKRTGVPVEYPPLGNTQCCSMRSAQ